MMVVFSLVSETSHAVPNTQEFPKMSDTQNAAQSVPETLTARQQAIVPIGAFAAVGDIANLNVALNEGLDAGMTVSDAKEVLVQIYAYAGFPRSLNALSELMKVLDARKQHGIEDAPGHAPSRNVATGEALLAAGTANQTKLSGAPVKGALFEFAPAIDTYLKTHLFGDIFARDNLDWQSRELATLGALAAMTGVEAQLLAHIRISMNTGLTISSLQEVAIVLEKHGYPEAAKRARAAIDKQLARD
jgi:alkylhydroperoxidase/carboxymuconolactone decarboxylase family protein YurZ